MSKKSENLLPANSSPLKIDGWKTCFFLLKWSLFKDIRSFSGGTVFLQLMALQIQFFGVAKVDISKNYWPFKQSLNLFHFIISITPPKFNSLSLKNSGWKTTLLSYWVSFTFQGRTVKLQGGNTICHLLTFEWSSSINQQLNHFSFATTNATTHTHNPWVTIILSSTPKKCPRYQGFAFHGGSQEFSVILKVSTNFQPTWTARTATFFLCSPAWFAGVFCSQNKDMFCFNQNNSCRKYLFPWGWMLKVSFSHYSIIKTICKVLVFLVGGFNPCEKYARQNGSFPQAWMKIKNVWKHHLSNEKNLGCLGYIGDDILPSYKGIIRNHCKGPY